MPSHFFLEIRIMQHGKKSKFVRYQLPCPKCGGSDPVSMNEDKSAHCFSCSTHFANYPEACEGKI